MLICLHRSHQLRPRARRWQCSGRDCPAPSAPDIAGQDKANPLATILSLAMMFKYTFNDQYKFDLIENAVRNVLKEGFRTEDIFSEGTNLIGCEEMGDKVIERLEV